MHRKTLDTLKSDVNKHFFQINVTNIWLGAKSNQEAKVSSSGRH